MNEISKPLAKYQCQQCSIGMYADGKCYADRKKGRPITDYYECYAAAPKKTKTSAS